MGIAPSIEVFAPGVDERRALICINAALIDNEEINVPLPTRAHKLTINYCRGTYPPNILLYPFGYAGLPTGEKVTTTLQYTRLAFTLPGASEKIQGGYMRIFRSLPDKCVLVLTRSDGTQEQIFDHTTKSIVKMACESF